MTEQDWQDAVKTLANHAETRQAWEVFFAGLNDKAVEPSDPAVRAGRLDLISEMLHALYARKEE